MEAGQAQASVGCPPGQRRSDYGSNFRTNSASLPGPGMTPGRVWNDATSNRPSDNSPVRRSSSRDGPGQGHSFAFVTTTAVVLLIGMLASELSSAHAAEPFTIRPDVSYDLGSPPLVAADNQLDLYRPVNPIDGKPPLVVFVHGGGWRTGDKSNQVLNKARLFTRAGYYFASINYRLSPRSGDPNNPDPNRVRFPDHPDDVGEAIGWLDGSADKLGFDPDRIMLIGHSAGAHLVSLISTDPRYIRRYGSDPRQVLGTISLDTAAFDIERAITRGNDPDEPNLLFINAFGTPEEDAVEGSWASGSPLTWADPTDPEHLLITQTVPYRVRENQAMAAALDQGLESVVQVPLNHSGINMAVGAPGDASGTTAAVNAFTSSLLDRYVAAKVSLTKRPARTVRLGRSNGPGKPKRRSVRFAFKGAGNAVGFQCRLDRAQFRTCRSPRRYSVGRGNHTFRVRPLFPSGEHGAEEVARFKVVSRALCGRTTPIRTC